VSSFSPQLNFLNPMLGAISLKHCLQRFNPYFLMNALIRKHRLHLNRAVPVVRSFGALCFKNFLSFVGFTFSCLNAFL